MHVRRGEGRAEGRLVKANLQMQMDEQWVPQMAAMELEEMDLGAMVLARMVSARIAGQEELPRTEKERLDGEIVAVADLWRKNQKVLRPRKSRHKGIQKLVP